MIGADMATMKRRKRRMRKERGERRKERGEACGTAPCVGDPSDNVHNRMTV